jgi:1,4-dihydroxy-2-naphthoate octaprenyltransferase
LGIKEKLGSTKRLTRAADDLKAIAKLGRLRLLAGGIVASSFGATLAWYETRKFNLGLLIVGMSITILTNLMVQYQNEYWDVESDRLSTQRIFSGGSGVLAKGLLPRRVASIISMTSLSLAVIVTLLLSYTQSEEPYILPIFLLTAFLSWAYSSPPIRLLSKGFGEVSVGFILGFLTPLFQYYLQTGTAGSILLFCFSLSFFVMPISLSFSYPDYYVDSRSGKRTLLVRLGWRRTSRLHILLIIAGYASLGAVGLTDALASTIYLPFLTVPVAMAMASILLKPEPSEEQLVRNSILAALLPSLIVVLQMLCPTILEMVDNRFIMARIISCILRSPFAHGERTLESVII